MYFKLVALYNFIINGILALTILAFREGFARIYTNQENLIPLVMDGYSIMCLVLMLHGLAMV